MQLLAAMSLVLASCVHLPGQPALSSLPTAREVRVKMEARLQAVQSFIMSGSIEVVAPQGELHGDHIILAKAPNHLRAEVLGPFGQPLLRMMTDGTTLTVLAFRENRAYQGPASRANLARFLGLALSPAEVYAVLAGSPPLLPPDSQDEVATTSLSGQALFKLVDAGGQVAQELIFSLSDSAVQRAWVAEGVGRWGLELEYGDLRPYLASRYPLFLKVRDQEGRLLALANDELKLNQSVDQALFQVRVPPGMTLVKLP